MKSLEDLKVNPKVSMLVPPLFCPYSSVLDIKKVNGDNFESIKELVLVKPCPCSLDANLGCRPALQSVTKFDKFSPFLPIS
jgi:hypothetical protein